MPPTKSDRWDQWISQTLLTNIDDETKPDPVPVFHERARTGTLERSEALDDYRYGRNDGEYLYLLYTLEGAVDRSESIQPIYVGESRNISTRLRQHSDKIREALPVESWTDDGSWGSWGKYDHMAAVYERLDTPLYAWICDVDTLDRGPYDYPTYRQELEAKLVSLIRSQPRFHTTFTNREFVPNRVLQQMGEYGPKWLDVHDSQALPGEREMQFVANKNKADCWESWVERYVVADINDQDKKDPIPLFDTTADGRVRLNAMDRLKRSTAIDDRIREAGRQCVNADGLRNNDYEGLLYVLYQLDTDDQPTPATIVPRYIGKAEASGKANKLSANFTEIATESTATRSFARWGDGDYWHAGELSMAVLEGDTRKLLWAAELFEDGTRRPEEELYLWVHPWDPTTDTGPYGYHEELATVEPLLIGTAYDAAPNQLLNKDSVPDDAPANVRNPTFETVSIESTTGTQQGSGDLE